tara:strand:- start:460 stop:600 length:141 start_codon:yes stop_codon:yes gene_type:complete
MNKEEYKEEVWEVGVFTGHYWKDTSGCVIDLAVTHWMILTEPSSRP